MRLKLLDLDGLLRRQLHQYILKIRCPFMRPDWIRFMIAAARLLLRSDPAKEPEEMTLGERKAYICKRSGRRGCLRKANAQRRR